MTRLLSLQCPAMLMLQLAALTLFALMPATLSAQAVTDTVSPQEKAPTNDDIWDCDLEQNAQFPGGDDACRKYVESNFHYAGIVRKYAFTGRLFVQFVVNIDGSLTDVKVVKNGGMPLNEKQFAALSKAKQARVRAKCEKANADEAIRLIKSMPRWKPAMQGNKPVKSRFNLPIIISPDK